MTMGATEAAVATLGVKFLGLARVYRHESSSVLDDMASLARAAVVLEPSLSDLMPFVRRLGALREAEEHGVRSARFDKVQDSMEDAMRRASSCFMDRLGAEGLSVRVHRCPHCGLVVDLPRAPSAGRGDDHVRPVTG